MRLLICILLSIVATPVLSEDVPFAERTPMSSHNSGDSDDLHSGSLGQFMELAQTWHIKLWYSGTTNKDLSLYTLERMIDGFTNAAMLYQNIPVRYAVALDKPFSNLRVAVEEMNAAKFAKGYSDLTDACNVCHRAANVGFIVIKKPVHSPFGDQQFDFK